MIVSQLPGLAQYMIHEISPDVSEIYMISKVSRGCSGMANSFPDFGLVVTWPWIRHVPRYPHDEYKRQMIDVMR